MGWKEVTIMSQRLEFVTLSQKEGSNISNLCRRFNISRKTGYKFINRYKEEGFQGLYGRSKRPKNNPNTTSQDIEQLILDLRDKHPAWGGRKLKRRLENMGYTRLPAASTIASILRRNGRISDEESKKHKTWQYFEAEKPNDLWQMDFKGHFPVREGRCHPLTILDDHSRYAIGIRACENERKNTVEQHLIEIFQRYGMPYAILVDNGAPWGHASQSQHTKLTVWLMCLRIEVIHSRPNHPQTLGKDERFHRTMRAEVVSRCIDRPISDCQKMFDQWRIIYNAERPHEALKMEVPSSIYQVSIREFPEKVPEIQYGPNDYVRKVMDKGMISFKNKEYHVGHAFIGQHVAVRPTSKDGKFDVFFCHQKIAQIDLV